MGKDRDYRVIIPGALLLLSFFLSALGAYGFHANPFTAVKGEWVAALVLLVVADFGGGFLCGNVTVLVLRMSRGRQTERLRTALALPTAGADEVWAEAHRRFHDGTRDELVRFATGRNTAMFACFNSAIAIGLGWFLTALSIAVCWLPKASDSGWRILLWFLVVIVGNIVLLIINGLRARTEHFEVFIRSV